MIRVILSFFAALAAMIGLAPLVAVAEPALVQCLPRDLAVATLTARPGVSRQVEGLTADGLLLELFGSEEDGQWIALVTRPDGMTCTAGGGTNLHVETGPPDGDPA